MGSVRQRGYTVRENTLGRLDHTKGNKGMGSYVGTCIVNGREHTRTMRGEQKEVIKRWENWQQLYSEQMRAQDVAEPSDVMPAHEQKEVEQVPKAEELPKTVSIIIFRTGRNAKNIAAYWDENKAQDIAEALESASELMNVDGSYDIEVIEVKS